MNDFGEKIIKIIGLLLLIYFIELCIIGVHSRFYY